MPSGPPPRSAPAIVIAEEPPAARPVILERIGG